MLLKDLHYREFNIWRDVACVELVNFPPLIGRVWVYRFMDPNLMSDRRNPTGRFDIVHDGGWQGQKQQQYKDLTALEAQCILYDLTNPKR